MGVLEAFESLGGLFPFEGAFGEVELNGAEAFAGVGEALGIEGTVAECGGFLYLQRTLQDQGRHPWLMASALDAEGFPTGQLSRFGYITLRAKTDSLLFEAGEEMPAHEFHYWDSTDPGRSFEAQKPLSQRHWETGVATPSLYAGFPHFHFASKPQAAVRFLAAARRWREAQKEMQQK